MLRPRLALPLLATVLATPAMAADNVRLGMGLDPVISSFTLYYERYETGLAMGGNAVDTRIERLGFSFSQPLARHLYGDVDLGYLATFQDDHPVIGDNDLDGGYLGVSLTGSYPLGEVFALGSSLGYSYNWADGEVNGVETDISWGEARARAWTELRLPAARLRIGVQGQHLDGEMTYETAPTQTFTFDAGNSTGAFAGIDLYTSGAGRISLYGQTGDREGFTLGFAADY
ncbi:MAG: hypothetical protein LPK43_03950 [Gammaproteobacteria bacterium]|nr:hypothetical protein [Gammaproteobacteria bacterium]